MPCTNAWRHPQFTSDMPATARRLLAIPCELSLKSEEPHAAPSTPRCAPPTSHDPPTNALHSAPQRGRTPQSHSYYLQRRSTPVNSLVLKKLGHLFN